MGQLVLLDAGPLGVASNPTASPLADRCNRWLELLLERDISVAVPEIADYEVRRELLRTQRWRSLSALDALKDELLYFPITTRAMLRAAAFWAQARSRGRPTADPQALDADAILAGQAAEAATEYQEVVVATTNPDHLSLFVDAEHWEDIG